MRLLLAEDEQALSKALKAILEHAGYTVNAVYDGKAALDCLGTGNYDGAVLDIMMPVLDGLEVLRQLRARRRPIPACGWATSRSIGRPVSCPRPRQLPAGEPGISDAGNAAVQPGAYPSGSALSGAHLGAGRRHGEQRGICLYFLSAEKAGALHADIRIRAVRGEGYVLEAVE